MQNKDSLSKLRAIGILFELIGILIIIMFNLFFQQVYKHNITQNGKKVILMMMPENRIVLWIGFVFLLGGFIINIFREFSKTNNNGK